MSEYGKISVELALIFPYRFDNKEGWAEQSICTKVI